MSCTPWKYTAAAHSATVNAIATQACCMLAGDPGPQGAGGAIGPAGVSGADGLIGRQGVDGIEGDVGPQGFPGDNGFDGSPGPQGLRGVFGENIHKYFIHNNIMESLL